MVAALLPFPRGSQVSGTGGWGHLASGVGGVLEHWAMAFTPSHAIINIAIDKVIRNMAQPYDPNGKKKKGDASHTIATTGPGGDHSTSSPNPSQSLAYRGAAALEFATANVQSLRPAETFLHHIPRSRVFFWTRGCARQVPTRRRCTSYWLRPSAN